MKPKVWIVAIVGVIVAIALVILISSAISNAAHDPVTGVVERIGTAPGSEYVSIKLEDNLALYSCDERCYAIREGDTVTLKFAPISGTEISRITLDQPAERKAH